MRGTSLYSIHFHKGASIRVKIIRLSFKVAKVSIDVKLVMKNCTVEMILQVFIGRALQNISRSA